MTTIVAGPGAFEGYLAWYSVRRRRQTGATPKPSTLQSKGVHLSCVARAAGVEGECSLGTLLQDRVAVEHMLDKLAAGLTTGGMRSYVYSLKSFAEYAKLRGWCEEPQLFDDDIPPPNPQKGHTIYTSEEVDQFISASRGMGVRWWALISSVADTGRRIGELLSWRWDEFHLDERPAYVELPVNKSGKPQYVPLPKRLVTEVFTDENILKLMKETRNGRRQFNRSPEEYPFPWTYSTVFKRFQHFCDSTGLPNRGFHNFRHTLITRRLAAGVPIHVVSKLAGHSGIQVTDRMYNHATALDVFKYVEED